MILALLRLTTVFCDGKNQNEMNAPSQFHPTKQPPRVIITLW